VVRHADDDEGRRRSVGDQVRQGGDAVVPEDRLVDDHDRWLGVPQQPAQVGQVRSRRHGRDVRLGLEPQPERPARAPVRDREEDRDGGVCDGCGLRRHLRPSIARRRPAFIGERR
jgi:hypothetical protein